MSARWEYHYEASSAYSRESGNGELPTLDALANLGAEGWELVAVAPAWGNDAPTFVFKRALPRRWGE